MKPRTARVRGARHAYHRLQGALRHFWQREQEYFTLRQLCESAFITATTAERVLKQLDAERIERLRRPQHETEAAITVTWFRLRAKPVVKWRAA